MNTTVLPLWEFYGFSTYLYDVIIVIIVVLLLLLLLFVYPYTILFPIGPAFQNVATYKSNGL